jgi:hypothetical protein
MKSKNKTSLKLTKKAITIAVIAVLIVGAGGYYAWRKQADKKKAPQTTSGLNLVNYGPPTEQEKQDAAAHKDDVVDQMNREKQPTPAPDTKKQVKPIITSISTSNNEVTITAYTSGIFEEGGTCTLSATKDATVRTFVSPAFANATTTDCKPFRISPSEFPGGGDWSFKISYTSPTAAGTSDAKLYKVN